MQPNATFAATTAATVPTEYTDAIDWGTQVASGDYNADGDMIIEYYFQPMGQRFGFFTTQEWTAYEKQRVEAAFDLYENIMNVEFVETSVEADAEFKLNKVDARGLYLGVMNPPGNFDEGSAGFASDGTGWDTSGGLEQGGFGFITLIHEFGHGLGLAHPHDTGGGSTVLPGVIGSSSTGFGDLNQGIYTTMSYVDGWATNPDGALDPSVATAYGYQGTPMAVDVALLQDKYGANMAYMTGDNVYLLPDVNAGGTFYSCIWDAGGTDEIRYNGSANVVIDLRPATLELEQGGGGWLSYASGIYGGYTIANGVVIENATGGSGNDALIGNAADNTLTGGAGADTFIFVKGQAGYDTITDFEKGVDKFDVSDYGVIRVLRNLDVDHTADGLELSFFDQTVLLEGLGTGETGSTDYMV
ncbi:M10 family metallopeptidase [Roseivivax sp. CAU 1753]